MRSLLLPLLAGAVVAVPSDENTLLQSRALRPRTIDALHPIHSSTEALLQSVRNVAKSFTQDAVGTMTPEAAGIAIEAATAALTSILPALQEEHDHAQHEVHRQIDEIEACGGEAHGLANSAATEAEIARQRSAVERCNGELGTANEANERECGEWDTHAARLAHAMPECHQTSTPELLFETFVEWEDWVLSEGEAIRLQRTECNDAASAAAAKAEECTDATSTFTENFCSMRLTCALHHACHSHEVEVYTDMLVDIRAMMLARQDQFRTIAQVECLMTLITGAIDSNTTIANEELNRCGSDVSVESLVLEFPDPPAAHECPPSRDGDPVCENLPDVADSAPTYEFVGVEALTASNEALRAPPSMPWRLALNIDTDDGNAVNYANGAFWESEAELGGASSNRDEAFSRDYKNPDVFNDGRVTDVLVVVHSEGEMLGWRTWRATGNYKTLQDYFSAGNTCGGGQPSLEGSIQLADESTDGEAGSLDPHEPLVVNSAGRSQTGNVNSLWINAGGGNDFNRLSTARHPPENEGYGLGTVYDLQTNGWSLCETATMRPQADAQFHVDQHHWGSQGGIGGLIGTDHVCNTDGAASCPQGRCSGCPWTVASGINYDYAIFVALTPDASVGVGSFTMTSAPALTAPPDMEWRLALNIDTGDGNAVHFGNAAFWESETELGGASSDFGEAFTRDYKNPQVFSAGLVSEILIVVHDEGEMLGWRRWRATQEQSSLRDYFTASNTCAGGRPTLANSVHLAGETIDAETGRLDPHEPFVVNTDGRTAGTVTDLWINAGGGNDFNRLSTAQHPPENEGYGLGTVYDLQTNGWSLCETATMRPQADAQFHVDQHHWGSQGGIGGLIGTDHVCNTDGQASCPEGRCSGCPWTVVSGFNYDYAIFVSTAPPVVAEVGGTTFGSLPSLTSPPEGDWWLAMNIDTNDGNAVNYGNAAFWESAEEMGGATDDEDNALTQDYKNTDVFNRGPVQEILIVVHDEGDMLGWRRWRATRAHSSLKDYFTAGNTCEGGRPTLAASVHLADESIDADTGLLDPHEPLVVNSAGRSQTGDVSNLWINAGGGNDFNRLSTAQHPPENEGYGLGTVYDLQTNGWSLCGTATMRPQADAQFHVDQHHWGSAGGIGGLIGTDHICNTDGSASCPEGRCSGCPWTVASGINYDYAIYVSFGPPTYTMVDGCQNQNTEVERAVVPADSGATASVRCCSEDGTECETSEVEGGCNSGKTYEEAVEICEASGGRLCTEEEINSRVCCGTGCGFDGHQVWVES